MGLLFKSKRGNDRLWLTGVEAILVISVVILMFAFVNNIKDNQFNSKVYLARDTALLTSVMYSHPMDIDYSYKVSEIDLENYRFSFQNKRVLVDQLDVNGQVQGYSVYHPYADNSKIQTKLNTPIEGTSTLYYSLKSDTLTIGKEQAVQGTAAGKGACQITLNTKKADWKSTSTTIFLEGSAQSVIQNSVVGDDIIKMLTDQLVTDMFKDAKASKTDTKGDIVFIVHPNQGALDKVPFEINYVQGHPKENEAKKLACILEEKIQSSSIFSSEYAMKTILISKNPISLPGEASKITNPDNSVIVEIKIGNVLHPMSESLYTGKRSVEMMKIIKEAVNDFYK